MDKPISVREATRFDLLEKKLPEQFSGRTHEFLHWSSDAIASSQLESISEVVAYTPYSWEWNINSLQLIVFAEYETKFSIIDKLSEALADVYREMLVLPIIVPIQEEAWALHVEYGSRLFNHVEDKSIYSYSREEAT